MCIYCQSPRTEDMAEWCVAIRPRSLSHLAPFFGIYVWKDIVIMSMMRRILRHVPGGVVAIALISYILLNNYCFIAIEKMLARGARTHYLSIRIQTHYPLRQWLAFLDVPVKCLHEVEKSWAKEYIIVVKSAFFVQNTRHWTSSIPSKALVEYIPTCLSSTHLNKWIGRYAIRISRLPRGVS